MYGALPAAPLYAGGNRGDGGVGRGDEYQVAGVGDILRRADGGTVGNALCQPLGAGRRAAGYGGDRGAGGVQG